MGNLTLKDKIFIGIGIFIILLWLIGVTIWLVRLIKNYTFKDWGNKTNPYEMETLGLPRGTLRGVLTLTLLVVTVIMVCMSMIVRQLEGSYETIVDAFQVMLAFYFGSKVMHHITHSDKEKTQSKMEAETAKAKYAASENNAVLQEETEFEIPGAKG